MDTNIASDVVIRIENLGKRFYVEASEERSVLRSIQRWFQGGGPTRELWALKEASFSIRRGECVGIIGNNGAGKSILLSILAGLSNPTEGIVEIQGQVNPFFQMGASLYARLTVEKNIKLAASLLGLSRQKVDERFDAMIDFSDLREYRHMRVGELSTGLAARIPFAAAMEAPLDIVLIDEMFLVGDAAFQGKCFREMERLKSQGKTLVIVSHNLKFIGAFCSRCICLEHGRLMNDGPPIQVIEKYLSRQPQMQNPAGKLFRRRPSISLQAYTAGKAAFVEKFMSNHMGEIQASLPASDEDVLTVHSLEWLQRLRANDLTKEEELLWTFPQSRSCLPFAWNVAGGTIAACRSALANGFGFYISGGLRHAFPTHGAGLCSINDVAIALRVLFKEKLIQRPLIIDLDAHEADGTSFIFKDDPRVCLFSMYNQEAYPAIKEPRSPDIALPPRACDNLYLKLLEKRLPSALSKHRPDFIFYVAAADPYEKDPLGGLSVSINGLKQRDDYVFRLAADNHLPVAVSAGGGYGPPQDVAQIHMNTVQSLFAAFPLCPRRLIV